MSRLGVSRAAKQEMLFITGFSCVMTSKNHRLASLTIDIKLKWMDTFKASFLFAMSLVFEVQWLGRMTLGTRYKHFMRQNYSSCFLKLWWQECLDLQRTCCTIYFTSENVYRRFYEHHEHACCCVVLQKVHQRTTSLWCELFPTFLPRAAGTPKATVATVMHWNLRERFFLPWCSCFGKWLVVLVQAPLLL